MNTDKVGQINLFKNLIKIFSSPLKIHWLMVTMWLGVKISMLIMYFNLWSRHSHRTLKTPWILFKLSNQSFYQTVNSIWWHWISSHSIRMFHLKEGYKQRSISWIRERRTRPLPSVFWISLSVYYSLTISCMALIFSSRFQEWLIMCFITWPINGCI